MKGSFRFSEIAFVFLFFLLTQFFSTGDAIHAPLTMMDDYATVLILHSEKMPVELNQNNDYTSISGLLKMDYSLGRFRPFYWVQYYFKTKLFGTNAFLWHLTLLFTGAICSALFYLVLRIFRTSFLIAMLFSLMFLFNQHSQIWWLLGPAETPGVLFLLLSIVLILRPGNSSRSKYFGLVFLLISGLCKESFIFIVPVVGILYNYVEFRKNKPNSFREIIKANSGFNLALAIVFLLPVACLFMTISGRFMFNYGVDDSFASVFAGNFFLVLKSSLFLAPAWIWIYLAFGKKEIFPHGIIMAMTVFLWISGSILVYKSNYLTGRYFVPANILPIAVSAIAMEAIRKFRVVFGLMLLLNILFLVNNAKNTFISSARYTKEAIAYNRMLDFIVDRQQPCSLGFYIDASSKIPYEFIHSVLAYTSYRSNRSDQIYINVENEKQLVKNSLDDLLLAKLKKKFKNLDDIPIADRKKNTWVVGESLAPPGKLDSIALFTEAYFNVSFFRNVENINSIQFFVGKLK